MATRRRYASDDKAAAELAHALQELPDDWVMCRDMRHAWGVYVNFHVTDNVRNNIQEIQRQLICSRCETVRKEVYHNSRYGLEKVHQYYTYPDHYQIKGVPRGVKPQSIVQGEQYRRAMEHLAKGAARAEG